jgi:hypothetical protein
MFMTQRVVNSLASIGGRLILLATRNHINNKSEIDSQTFHIETFKAPLFYSGPEDVKADNYDLPNTWKVGPINLSWNETEECWDATGGGGMVIHHHLDNSLVQGGLAFAYFFR